MLRGCLPRCMSSTAPATWKCWVWSPRSTLHWVCSPADTGVSSLLRSPSLEGLAGVAACSLLTAPSPQWEFEGVVGLVGWERKLERGCAWLEVISTKLFPEPEQLWRGRCGWTVRSEERRRFVDSLKNGLVVTRLWGRSRSSLRSRGRLLLLLGRLLLPHPGHVPLLPPPVHVHLLQVSLHGFLDRVPWSFRLWPWSESNQRELYDMKKTILIKINVFTKSTSDHVWRNYCKI